MRRIVPFASLLLVAACADTYNPVPVASAPRPPAAAPAPSLSGLPYPAAVVPQASAEVRDAQHRLRMLGLYDGPIDGIWGPATQAAVERFQRERGLALTARLDGATLRAIRTDAAPVRGAVAATPIPIADATDVRTLQNRLRQLGFFDRAADGVWGPSTQVALENFQRARGLPPGQVTTATVSAMGLDPAAFPSRTAAAPLDGDMLEPRVVRHIQRRLRQLGFYSGNVDAVWGPATQTALERFQKSRGLEATGQLNPTTAGALGFDPNNLTGSVAVRRQ